jgi:acetyl-CoA synthetase
VSGAALRASRSYRESCGIFNWADVWDLFDGDRASMNLASECLDRHPASEPAVRIWRVGDDPLELTFGELTASSARFAHRLQQAGVKSGDRVAIMAEPSLAFYSAVFGTIRYGAVAVPLFTLFGPDAVAARIKDSGARMLVVDREREAARLGAGDAEVMILDDAALAALADLPTDYDPTTGPDDLALLQYTSGTSRQLPDGVRHTHRAVVSLMPAALYGLGLDAGDRYFCPPSPAWGHGMWHGTIAPLALGIAAGSYSGRFAAAELTGALDHFAITNLAAAGTVYRMLLRDRGTEGLPHLEKASYTGESMDEASLVELGRALGAPICGMYGTTETGVTIANFPGFADHEVRPGALGRPLPGLEVAVIDPEGRPLPVGVVGEIAIQRRGDWFRAKDLARVDEDGYYWYLGRADDIIISAGWTISPIEVENALLTHPDVSEVAVIGVPDDVRGHVLKAYVVASRRDEDFEKDLQEFVRSQLSAHEYPRQIEFADDLPRTNNGKINRRALRDLSAASVEGTGR